MFSSQLLKYGRFLCDFHVYIRCTGYPPVPDVNVLAHLSFYARLCVVSFKTHFYFCRKHLLIRHILIFLSTSLCNKCTWLGLIKHHDLAQHWYRKWTIGLLGESPSFDWPIHHLSHTAYRDFSASSITLLSVPFQTDAVWQHNKMHCSGVYHSNAVTRWQLTPL